MSLVHTMRSGLLRVLFSINDFDPTRRNLKETKWLSVLPALQTVIFLTC